MINRCFCILTPVTIPWNLSRKILISEISSHLHAFLVARQRPSAPNVFPMIFTQSNKIFLFFQVRRPLHHSATPDLQNPSQTGRLRLPFRPGSKLFPGEYWIRIIMDVTILVLGNVDTARLVGFANCFRSIIFRKQLFLMAFTVLYASRVHSFIHTFVDTVIYDRLWNWQCVDPIQKLWRCIGWRVAWLIVKALGLARIDCQLLASQLDRPIDRQTIEMGFEATLPLTANSILIHPDSHTHSNPCIVTCARLYDSLYLRRV